MYQNTFVYAESRMQDLRTNSAKPAGTPASFSELVRQEAADALIGLGNWIKPHSERSQSAAMGVRQAGFAN
jgi:hypothetical protein